MSQFEKSLCSEDARQPNLLEQVGQYGQFQAVDNERKCHFEDQRGELSQALDTYYQSLRFIEYHGWIASPESLAKYEDSEDFMGTNRNT
ncbi:hypothetical protein VB005_01142 [Metarhizium brunneum]